AQDVSAEVAKGFGVPGAGGAIITSVDPSSPAQEANLRAGDVILAVGDTPVSDPRALIRTIALLDPGSAVDLTIWRNHARQIISVTPIQWPNMGSPAEAAMAPAAMAAMAPATEAGPKLATITEDSRRQFSIPPTITGGAVVETVSDDNNLGDQGLRAGDVIINVDGTPVTTPSEVQAMIGKARDGKRAYLPMLVSGKDGLRWVSYYTGVPEPG
ncbi:MAG TPA: PDZ domain-containing protein, partial [Acetobacteraceae bacterium]|nr:PDZ domain-containing protein [Acetobacteraceae bacterium]